MQVQPGQIRIHRIRLPDLVHKVQPLQLLPKRVLLLLLLVDLHRPPAQVVLRCLQRTRPPKRRRSVLSERSASACCALEAAAVLAVRGRALVDNRALLLAMAMMVASCPLTSRTRRVAGVC